MDSKTIIKQVIDESYKRGVGHIGSCITAVPILNTIYSYKSKEDVCVLSSGHAGLALFMVLKAHDYPIKLDDKGTHPDRIPEEGIEVSAGSLGHGIGIAVGYALADRSRFVYCVSTDGEIAEGSWWEAMNIAVNQNLSNLKVFINCNGYSAYDPVDTERIVSKLLGWGVACLIVDNTDPELIGAIEETVTSTPLAIIVKSNSDFSEFKGLEAHYKPLTKEQYKKL